MMKRRKENKTNKSTTINSSLSKRKEARFKNVDEQRKNIYSQSLIPHKKSIARTTHARMTVDKTSRLLQNREKENKSNKAAVKGSALVKASKWKTIYYTDRSNGEPVKRYRRKLLSIRNGAGDNQDSFFTSRSTSPMKSKDIKNALLMHKILISKKKSLSSDSILSNSHQHWHERRHCNQFGNNEASQSDNIIYYPYLLINKHLFLDSNKKSSPNVVTDHSNAQSSSSTKINASTIQDFHPCDSNQTGITNDQCNKKGTKNRDEESNILNKLEDLMKKWDLRNEKEDDVNEKRKGLINPKDQKSVTTFTNETEILQESSTNGCQTSSISGDESRMQPSTISNQEEINTAEMHNNNLITRYASFFKEERKNRYYNNSLCAGMDFLLLEKRLSEKLYASIIYMVAKEIEDILQEISEDLVCNSI